MSDYKESLEKMGYKLTDHGAYWRTNALYRSGDNRSALQIYKDSGVWKDFVEDTIFLPFKALVEKTLNTKDDILISQYMRAGGDSFGGTHKEKKYLKQEKTYNEVSLTKLLPHYDFYLDKGIKEESLKDFKCGLAMSNTMYQRTVFPIFRNDGKIHGFSGRKVLDSDSRPKWLHVGKKSKWIYPYFTISDVEKAIKEYRSVHVVESIGDALNLYDKGVKNVLVSFGLSVSPMLTSFLGNLDIDKIFVSFNNDFNKDINRGFEGSAKCIMKLTESIDFEKVYFLPPAKNDFGVMNQEEIDSHIEKCELCSHEDSCLEVTNIALDTKERNIRERKRNKSFEASIKKYQKKVEFNYEQI